MNDNYRRFADFYPFYLAEHRNRTCRRLHFVGSALVLVLLMTAIIGGDVMWLWAMPPVGYGFAWIGHAVFEKNRPATFRYPLFSLLGDWVMFKDIVIGRIKF